MFYTSTNPCHRVFTSTSSFFSSVACVMEFLMALSNLICLYRSLPWYSQPSIADYPKYRTLHRWLHKMQITDQTGQIKTDTEARGYYGFCTQNEDKINDKISVKTDTKCNNYTPCMSHRAIWSMQIMHTDLLGNTHPWKLTETCSGCHITQPTQHITLCCQELIPN